MTNECSFNRLRMKYQLEAKVRHGDSQAMGSHSLARIQLKSHCQSIFSVVGIVAFADSRSRKSHRLIKPLRRHIRPSYFKHNTSYSLPFRVIQDLAQQQPRDPLAAKISVDGDIVNVDGAGEEFSRSPSPHRGRLCSLGGTGRVRRRQKIHRRHPQPVAHLLTLLSPWVGARLLYSPMASHTFSTKTSRSLFS